MWRTNPEQTIGRGEVAESRVEAPILATLIIFLSVILFVVHVTVQNQAITMALTVSMFVFGITIVRVEFGLYILLIAMMLSPEIGAGAVGDHNERDVNFRYDDILILVIFLGIMVKQAFSGQIMFWRANPVNPGIVAYFGACIISTLRALERNVPAWDAPVAAFVMLKMLEFYLIFFMVSLAVTSVGEIRRQLRVFFAVAIIVAGYATLTIGRLDRVSAPFESGGTEPNTLGGYLLIVICLAIGLAIASPRQTWRIGFISIALLSFYPFIQTLSRASYGALAVAVLAMGVMGRRWAFVGFTVLLLYLSPHIMPEKVTHRVSSTFQEDGGQTIYVAGKETSVKVDKSTYERIYIWEKVRFNLTVWPWFGGGVSWETVLDSQYARVLLETGIVGFAAYLFLLYRVQRTIREARRWSKDWVVRGLSLGMIAATIGLLVHSMGTISFLIVRIMEPFWFLTALVIVGRQLAIEEHEEQRRAQTVAQPAVPELPDSIEEPPKPRPDGLLQPT